MPRVRAVWLIVPLIILLVNLPLGSAAESVLIIGTLEPLINLDPADSATYFEWEVLTHLYTGLTRQVHNGLTYELALAESHEVSSDGLTHVFRLRADAVFNDGTPITAQTFADSINRVLRLRGRAAEIIAPYVRSALVDESGTLQLMLVKALPLSFVRQLVALPPFFPLHRQSFPLERLNRRPELSALRTNGIYRLSAYSFDEYRLVADETWRSTPPQTRVIVLRRYQSSAALREALKRGEVQVAWRGLAEPDGREVQQAAAVRAHSVLSSQCFYLIIGQRREPFNALQARQVLMHSLSRARAVSDGLGGYGAPLYTFTPLSSADVLRYPDFDLDALRSVLSQGNYSRFRQVLSEVQTSRLLYGDSVLSATTRLFSQVATVDAVRFNVQDLEPRAFLDQIDRRAFRLIVIGWSPLVPHPYAYFEPLLTGKLAINAEYDTQEASELLARAALDDSYEALEQLAMRDLVAIPLWQSAQVLYAAESVRGVLIEPNFLLRYDQLRLA
ncbi:MAG: ABC transporter substrate-binding protein [Anaerolineae bacterium]|nr:ABC transporter substrate-binding protein [Anaerolineae bacterium]